MTCLLQDLLEASYQRSRGEQTAFDWRRAQPHALAAWESRRHLTAAWKRQHLRHCADSARLRRRERRAAGWHQKRPDAATDAARTRRWRKTEPGMRCIERQHARRIAAIRKRLNSHHLRPELSTILKESLERPTYRIILKGRAIDERWPLRDRAAAWIESAAIRKTA